MPDHRRVEEVGVGVAQGGQAADKRAALVECLADDPRPSYQDDGRVYTMPYAGREVDFTVLGDTLTVVAVR